MSSYRAIENLIATYAELVDDGDFAGVGALLADAAFTGGAGSVSGGDAIEKMLKDMLVVYDDGTPRTKHVTTNVAIEVDEEAGTAVSRSYFTALQAVPDLALQPIVSGRYHDRFERRDGKWRFVERHVRTDLVGDVSRHLRPALCDQAASSFGSAFASDAQSSSNSTRHLPSSAGTIFSLARNDRPERPLKPVTGLAVRPDAGCSPRSIDSRRLSISSFATDRGSILPAFFFQIANPQPGSSFDQHE